jgi:hypothetical protein
MAAFEASITIRGLAQLDAALRQLPEDVAGPIMADALAESGEIIRAAAADNIHSKSGRTAADLRVEVQNEPAATQGAAAIGGTTRGTAGRAHVLRWLEFGTKPHVVVAGAQERRDARRAARALRRLGDTAAAAALRRALRAGTVTTRHALKLPNGVYRASAGKKNPISAAAQSPLTRALAESGDRAISVFKSSLWNGISTAARRLNGTGR